jgi:hypothetical protein
MGVSRLQPSGGANDFTLDIGSSGNTTFQLTKEYAPGAYSITSQLADASLDIYLINADGSSAGYTNTKSLTATKGFNKIVVYGASTNDLLIFEYKTTFSPTGIGNVDSGAAPFATAVSPSDLPDIDDTTTITGGNFASDVAVTFTGTNAVALNAKSIVRASSTSLLVTRPDNLIQDHSPYDVTITNPGLTNPSVNVHRLNDAITAGGDPVWVTAAGALTAATTQLSYSVALQATDPDGGTVTYSVATGALPTGLSLNSSTGTISGIPTAPESGTQTFSFTVAATDSGGNITNRSFSIASTAGAYGFSPFVWYDLSTSAGYTLSGTTVTSLVDRSPNSLNASVVGSPQFSATAYNSRPGVTLNGSNQGFTTPNIQFSSPGLTIFMVVKLTNTGMFLEHSGDANNGSFYLYSATGNSMQYRGSGNGSTRNYTNGWTNDKSLIVYQYNGTNDGNFIRANRALMTGANPETANPGFVSVNAPIYMFSRGHSTLWSSGTFSEMVVYKQVLTLSEIQSVENALYTKWGIS